jgi:hypothetical protein
MEMIRNNRITYIVIDWCCYYTQVSYTGSWEPLVEMLDKLIPYIVCWCKTLYQTLPVVGINRITLTIATRSDTGSHNRFDLIQSLIEVFDTNKII